MSGVIDQHGVQWEHCCACEKFIRMEDLGYQRPCAKYKYGRDLCIDCVRTGIESGEIEFDEIQPSHNWLISERLT